MLLTGMLEKAHPQHPHRRIPPESSQKRSAAASGPVGRVSGCPLAGHVSRAIAIQ